jgi:hypothetical protein
MSAKSISSMVAMPPPGCRAGNAARGRIVPQWTTVCNRDDKIAIAAQIAALRGRGRNSPATTRTETQAVQSMQLGR